MDVVRRGPIDPWPPVPDHRTFPRKWSVMSFLPPAFTRLPIAMAAYGAVILLLATATLSFASAMAGAVLIWPVNAVAVSMLTRQPVARLPQWLAVTAVAMLLSHVVLGIETRLALGFSAINLIEITVVATLLRRSGADPMRLRGYALTILAAMAGAAVSTPLAAGLSAAVGGPVSVLAMARWFAASVMGMVIVVPALGASRRDLPGEGTIGPVALVLLPSIAALVATLVFGIGNYPLLFLLMPCGVFAAFHHGFGGAALTTLTIAIVATIFTVHGDGPIAASFPETIDRFLFLQLFLSAITLTAFPMATLLHHRDRALEQTRAAERELRLLTDHSTDLILRIGMDGIRRYASPASQQLLGYAPEELVGRSSFERMHPDDKERMRRACLTLTENGVGVVRRYRQRHRDGQYVWLEGAFRLTPGDGPVGEIVATVRDIGLRQAAEQAATAAIAQLEERQRLLAMAEAAAQIGHWRIDHDGQRLFWSPEVFRIHGLPVGDAPPLGDAVDCYHPDDRAMVRSRIAQTFAGEGPFAFEARLHRNDGALRWVSTRGQAEQGPDGTTVGLFGVFQDITEQVTAMAELRAAREAAERALAARATFVATISHEIRTPLTAILAAAQLLRDTPERVERMRHLDSLEQAGRTLSHIVDDVLTFSKLEAGQGEAEAIAFEPDALIAGIAGMFATDAAAHGIALEADIAPGRVIGDPARLQRVLTNLVGNAIKFTRAGSVRITATASGGDLWCFDVADTGVGIRDDRLEAIFEPFVQADASTTRSYGGTGLGLSISRMLVESMGGAIGVDSRAGEGSRFWFTLPLPATVAATSEIAPPPPTAPVRPRSILVAEDNDTNRYLIAEIVRRLGHHVVAVEHGARAVEYVTDRAGHPIDLVLMDVQMPVMDGIAATRAIRAWSGAGARVPIFALTADLSAERRAEVVAAGMNGVLAKPVDIAALRHAIAGVTVEQDEEHDTAPDVAAIDPGRVRALGETLGPAARDTLLGLLVEDAQRIPGRLRALVGGGRGDLARREAHALRGAAASVGAQALVAALRVVEDAREDAPIDPAWLDTIDRAAQAVVAAARAVSDPA
ncbi:hypothetical protein ASE78_06025 [Sphingomonas sp. Leaf25]|nr:hypothetical protein ASE78_06025 [Sphingomonas sp. Leaf25]